MSCCSVVLHLQWILILWLTLIPSSSTSPTPSGLAKPNCTQKCGEVTIPYPFGIGPNCFHDSFYEIFCNHSSKPPKPFLRRYNLELMEIRLGTWSSGDDQTLTVLAPPVNVCEKHSSPLLNSDFKGSPYRFSKYNDFLVLGCTGSVVMRNRKGQIVKGCSSICVNFNSSIELSACRGVGCCLLSRSTGDGALNEIGSEFYEVALDDEVNRITSPNLCNLGATLVGDYYNGGNVDYLEKITGNLSLSTKLPTTLQWYFTDSSRFHKAVCSEVGEGLQRCGCGYAYDGNPFLSHGCRVREGCENCPNHCQWNNTGQHFECEKTSWLKKPLIVGISTSIGSVLVIIGCYWLYRLIKWRREIWRKNECFKRNGGLLLQQQMSCGDGIIEKMTVFTATELEKATDNFHENRILGQGGQGTVYKGMLVDGRLVAIKKSTKVDQGQLDQFINEVVILSQINHRNVVKLLGCCLETEVPWLVYEFIPNGTLYQHIHDPTEDFHVGWKMRLQIAAESAGALAYLHSSSSTPIYHRDIKSSNILLDEKYRAKISDFGTSRAINIEQTHVTTRVQGTYGYLDPEYFQSNQFTEKSDVYSFGVVLVELLTGKKPIFPINSGEWKNLAVEFLSQMEMSCLFDIVDTRVVEEGKKEEFIAVAGLAKRCLNMNGKDRPTMKEVATVLHGIRSPNSKEPDNVRGKCVVTEISNSSAFTTEMFFTATASFSSLPIEVQPLMSNTQSC